MFTVIETPEFIVWSAKIWSDDERKEFMKSCLSDGKKRQQERMKTCNVDATGKKGDERKAFMSECLKKD